MDKQVVIYIFISIHKIEYYLAVKGNKLLIKAIHWMNLETIKLSRSQTQRGRKYDSIYVSFKTWKNNSGDGNQNNGCFSVGRTRNWKGHEKTFSIEGIIVSFLKIKM